MVRGSSFDGFDNAILGAAGRYTQTIADQVGGLVMARVDWNRQMILMVTSDDFRQPGGWLDIHQVCECHGSSGGVVDQIAFPERQKVRDVLHQRSRAMHV